MIKTHKPRGYFWTHASAFQQTKEFRNVCYDECLAPTAGSSLLGSDETHSEAQHARKRRRIEKLADDFLNGEPLVISSARPCPTSLKSSVLWNQRSSGNPKFELPNVQPVDDPKSIWHDAEDDEEVLHRYRARLESDQFALNAVDVPWETDSNTEGQEPVAPKAAQPGLRRAKLEHLTTGPSEDALRIAAALRARRAQRKESEALATAERETGSGRRLRSSERRCQPRTSNQWLSRRQSASVSARVDFNEESLDELRLSRSETPSNPPKGAQSSAISQSVAYLAISRRCTNNHELETDPDTIVVTPRADESSHLSLSNHDGEPYPPAGEEHNGFLDHNTYHTAPEETELPSEEDGLEDESQSQEDSQSRLLSSYGFKGASPTVWKSVNQHQTPLAQLNEATQNNLSEECTTYTPSDPQPTTRRTRRAAVAVPEASTAQKKATTNDLPTKRVGKQVIYTNGKPLANGSSPFRWRRKVTFPSSDEIIVEPRRQQSQAHGHKGVSQSAPVTPAGTTPGRSGDLQTLARVGAARSSPVLTSHTPAGTSAAQQSLPETWIGTQVMLYQAQKDLITSPEKTNPTAENVDHQPPDDNDNAANPTSQQSDREPLKHLSQEPAPSTQAMLGDFVGFSTVKKPWRGGPRESIDSPSVLLRANKPSPEPANKEPAILSHEVSQKQNTRRSSSLRFSLESIDSPLHSTNVDKPPSTTTPILRRPEDWSSTNIATSSFILKKPPPGSGSAAAKTSPVEGTVSFENESAQSEEESHLPSFSTALPLPSFQAAQRWSSLPREDEDVERTIDELATELLDTRDMDGVFSQVG